MCTDDGIFQEALRHYLVPQRAQENATPAEYVIYGNDEENPAPHESAIAYEAAEHQAIADGLTMRQADGSDVSASTIIASVQTSSGSVTLTFGRIIALAGDFFTNREHRTLTDTAGDYPPICGAFHQSPQAPTKRFQNAVNSLLKDEDGFLARITKLLDQEHHGIDRTLDLGKSPATTYHHGQIPDDFEPDNCKLPDDKAFFTSMLHISYPPLLSLYAWIAYTNADHFGEDAVKTYCVGHAVALKIASEARNEPDMAEKWKKLNLAYVHEAFAAHYLTDLFSSGHLRSPRRYLHAKEPLIMAKSTAVKLLEYPEVPIWDHQQRYMHDDDCATGLVVRNEQGDEWIAYGDKQFFEPKNVVNRARAALCLQASVDEIYTKGYQEGFNPIFRDEEDSWKTYKLKFDACKLLPIPMTACLSTDWVTGWGNYDMHNPAPLWIAGKVDEFGHVPDEKWTLRGDVNDHSNFKRAVGSPKEASSGLTTVEAREECLRIRDAPFRGDDQFAAQKPMTGLLSGGFLQVQDLQSPTKGAGTCLNFWNPAMVSINGRNHETFTIRNRLIDISTPAKTLPDSAVPIHWSLRNYFGHGGRSTYLAAFYWVPGSEGATSSIAFSEAEFAEEIAPDGDSEKVTGGKRINFDPTRSWKMKEVKTTGTCILSHDLPSGYEHANMTRFVVDRVLPVQHLSPDVVSVTALSDRKIQIAACNPQSPKGSFNKIFAHLRPFNGFVRAIATPNSGRKNLLLVTAAYENAKSMVDIYEYNFGRQNGTEEPKAEATETHLECPLNNEGAGESAVLVGDILGKGNDQVAVVNGEFDNPEIRLYTRTLENSSSTKFKLSGKSASPEEYDTDLVRPYLNALVPSCTGQGLDILQISLRQINGKKHLVFVTRVRSEQDAGDEDALIWDSSREYSVYDPLASSANGQYFHIKFIRTTHQPKRQGKPVAVRPAILEVFSWYGVLGVRLFAAGEKQWDYDLLGEQPYLGQTSIGAGLGSSGDWSNGFLTWASDDEWADVNVFKPKSKNNLKEGTWGVSTEDLSRPNVRGYEVEKRPLR